MAISGLQNRRSRVRADARPSGRVLPPLPVSLYLKRGLTAPAAAQPSRTIAAADGPEAFHKIGCGCPQKRWSLRLTSLLMPQR